MVKMVYRRKNNYCANITVVDEFMNAIQKSVIQLCAPPKLIRIHNNIVTRSLWQRHVYLTDGQSLNWPTNHCVLNWTEKHADNTSLLYSPKTIPFEQPSKGYVVVYLCHNPSRSRTKTEKVISFGNYSQSPWKYMPSVNQLLDYLSNSHQINPSTSNLQP